MAIDTSNRPILACMTDVDILYVRAGGQGWGPVDELADLCTRLLDATLTTIDDYGEVFALRKVSTVLPRRRGTHRSLLVIASSPAHLAYAARRAHWLPGYRRTVGWVIDSFWSDRISRFATRGRHVDHLFITDRDLIPEWRAKTGTSVSWAPWGTDTLTIREVSAARPTDLLRIGRQPDAWDDDDRTIRAAAAEGLVVEGRPPMHPDARENQRSVRAALARAKFVLAFSNQVSPAAYTHPTREYLTGRWTEALGCGTTVAGVAPASAGYTLWPGAAVFLDPYDLAAGISQLGDLVRGWSPVVASTQHAKARQVLDWRWRIRDVADSLDAGPFPLLDSEIAILENDEMRR